MRKRKKHVFRALKLSFDRREVETGGCKYDGILLLNSLVKYIGGDVLMVFPHDPPPKQTL